MSKIKINDNNLYEFGVNKERTKRRLNQIITLGYTEVGEAHFGVKGHLSGLYIERIWRDSDEAWKHYIIWAKDTLIEKRFLHGMTSYDVATYKRLQRQCQERYRKLYDQGNGGGRIKNRSASSFNTKLATMQKFLSEIKYGNFSANRWMKIKPEE